MPIYEYECAQCGQIEEVIQRFSDAPLTTCKNCSGKLNKLISQSTFHLKGSGWYVTDYAGKQAKPSASNEPKNKSTPQKAADAGTESAQKASAKPAAEKST